MEGLCLLQKPLKPTPFEADLLQLLELALAVYLGVMRELRALNEVEDNGILEPVQDRPNAIERERVCGEDEVLLGGRHDTSCDRRSG